MYPDDLLYTKDHEWARKEGNSKVRTGITWYAQDALGDVVFVKLPDKGSSVSAGDAFAEVESTKAVSDVYAPVSGLVTEVNEDLVDSPEKINEDPYGAGWIAIIEMSDESELADLMDAEAYRQLVESGEG
ncbi:MAG: glycine cleavage system protein H [Acidimicrobiia bacterium]